MAVAFIDRVERTAGYRTDAIHYAAETIDDQVAIGACGKNKGRFQVVSFNRDWEYAVIQALSQPENWSIPSRSSPRDFLKPSSSSALSLASESMLVDGAIRSFNMAMLHQGQAEDAFTDEQRGRYHHEAHTENSSQERLKDLKRWGHPVKENPLTGKLYYINHFSDDAQGLAAQAVLATAKAIDGVYGKAAGDNFLATTFPSLDAAGEHDDLRAVSSGLGLPVTSPKNSTGYSIMGWRDGLKAYVDDDGRAPEKEHILLPNAVHYVAGLRSRVAILERLGNDKRAVTLRGRAEYSAGQIEKMFWNEEEQTYGPVWDKNGLMKFVNCDPIDGIFTGVLNPEREATVVDRLFQDDMMTVAGGVRTRSANSPFYIETGYEAYQNGSPWGHRNTLLILGLIRRGDFEKAEQLLDYTNNYIDAQGFRELAICTKDRQKLEFYLEDEKPAACDLQTWFVWGYLGVSAWALRHSGTRISDAKQQLLKTA